MPIGFKFSDESKLKMSLAKLGKKNTEEHNRKIGLAHKGIHFSDEAKRNISLGKIGKTTGPDNHKWKGGRKISRGYIWILKPDHPFSNSDGYILESRFIMEQMIGRYLFHGEVIHHLNGIKDDNRIENLMLFESNGKHKKYENELKKVS